MRFTNREGGPSLKKRLLLMNTPEASYTAAYHALLNSAQVADIWRQLQTTGLVERYQLQDMTLEHDEDGFPYLACRQGVEYVASHVYAAVQLSVFLDLSPLLPSGVGKDYYLPFIVLPEYFDRRSFGELRLVVKHEVLHVKDLLTLVDRDPSYLTRVREVAFINLEDPGRLSESIEFEVFQLFYFEPRAFSMQYAQGEHTVRVLTLFYVILHRCESEKEYLELQLSQVVVRLAAEYRDKYPLQQSEMRRHFDRSLKTHGSNIFGDRVSLNRIEKRYNDFMDRMTARLERRRRAARAAKD